MAISITSASSAGNAQSDATQSVNDRVQLGKDDFLKLFITELRYQNALNPVDDREMLAQMAQFTSLEQVQNMSAVVDELARAQRATQATALIGRTITATTEEGEELSGVVSAVTFADGEVLLVVDGKEIPLSQVTGVSQGG